MVRFVSFFRTNSRIICTILFVLSFALFFVPISSPERYPLEYSPYTITRLFVQHPDAGANYAFAILFVFVTLWALEIIAVIVSKKCPLFFICATIPFSVVFFGTIYLVSAVLTPASAGVYIMAVIYVFLLCAIVAMFVQFTHPDLRKPKPERKRKPSKDERIAELEERVRELEQKQTSETKSVSDN